MKLRSICLAALAAAAMSTGAAWATSAPAASPALESNAMPSAERLAGAPETRHAWTIRVMQPRHEALIRG